MAAAGSGEPAVGGDAVARTDLHDHRFDGPDAQRSVVFGNVHYTPNEQAAIQRALKMHLSVDYVSFRAAPGGGEVAYLEGGRCTEIANAVFGFNGWSTMIRSFTVDYCSVNRNKKYEIAVTAVVRVTLKDGTFHEDVGCGSAVGNNKDQVIDKAKKQAVTDARKRALKGFGNALGQSLNNKEFIKYAKKNRHGHGGRQAGAAAGLASTNERFATAVQRGNNREFTDLRQPDHVDFYDQPQLTGRFANPASHLPPAAAGAAAKVAKPGPSAATAQAVAAATKDAEEDSQELDCSQFGGDMLSSEMEMMLEAAEMGNAAIGGTTATAEVPGLSPT